MFFLFYFFFFFFFFNDTATTEIYTLSLHDAPPIPRAGSAPTGQPNDDTATTWPTERPGRAFPPPCGGRGGRQSIPRFPALCQASPRHVRTPANRGTRAASSPQ